MSIHKHTHEQCQQAVNGIKDLLERIDSINDYVERKHVCESAIDLCNKLLREPLK
jgi:hypothetical protein